MTKNLLLVLPVTISAFHASNAFALPIAAHDIETFIAKSKNDPKRLYMLKVSATWCPPCKKETEDLSKYPAAERSAISRAFWNEIQTDKMPAGEYESFLKNIGISDSNGIPFNIAFKGGVPIGSIVGGDMGALKRFMSDAEVYTPSVSPQADSAKLVPKLPCKPRQNKDVCVIGVSGYEGPNKTDTDDFGRANLKTFADLFQSPKFEKLFAPPIPANAKKNTPSGNGVFYVRNPFLTMKDSFADPTNAISNFQELAQMPGNDLRVLMTGHGGRRGMTVGYKQGKYGPNGINFDSDAFSVGVKLARAAQKTVRGIVVQCFGGQYAPAFMPSKNPLATACAAFASLPEKESEGCYSSTYAGDRHDYMGVAARLKKCDNKQSARDLHYKIVAAAEGHDIPMLSSEYFLLFGEAAQKMAKNTVADAIGAVSKVMLNSGIELTINRLNNSIVNATYNGNAIALPQTSLVGCDRAAYGGIMDYQAPDHHHFSLFYLWNSTVGPTANEKGKADCTPTLRVSWPNSKENFPSAEISFEFDNGTRAGLSEAEKTLDLSGLKPEAKLLLSRIFPAASKLFEKAEYDSKAKLENRKDFLDRRKAVENIAHGIRPHDASIADAILDLLGKVEAQDKLKKYTQDIPAAMLRNISSYGMRDDEAPLLRLAHLLSAAIAETQLRKDAQTNPVSAELLKQLESLKACEKEIL